MAVRSQLFTGTNFGVQNVTYDDNRLGDDGNVFNEGVWFAPYRGSTARDVLQAFAVPAPRPHKPRNKDHRGSGPVPSLFRRGPWRTVDCRNEMSPGNWARPTAEKNNGANVESNTLLHTPLPPRRGVIFVLLLIKLNRS